MSEGDLWVLKIQKLIPQLGSLLALDTEPTVGRENTVKPTVFLISYLSFVYRDSTYQLYPPIYLKTGSHYRTRADLELTI